VTPSGQTQITDIEKLQRFWRDSKGRTRLEQFHIGPRLETNPRLLIWPVAEVLDPVAGSWCVLELEKKIAHRSPLPPPAPTPPSVGVMSAFPPGAEDLGTQRINGVPAQGQRVTSTVPADAQGDDRPLVHTRETWASPELQIPMLMKIHDSRGGDLTMDLRNLSRAEPDPRLFALPTDFRIVDENGEFTVTWGTPPLAVPPPSPMPPSQGSSGAYRIGSAPVPIYQPEPQYTEEARQAGIPGAVLLGIVVDENGQAQAIRVIRSLDPGLEKKAIEASRRGASGLVRRTASRSRCRRASR